MGQKIHPKGFRLILNHNWDSSWVASKREYPKFIKQDYVIRKYLMERLYNALIPKILIERANNRVRIKIFTARPSIIIGRKAIELDKVKSNMTQLLGNYILIDIKVVRKKELIAPIVAQNITSQLERRLPYRRVIKKSVQVTMNMGANGIKIQCSGRLGGVDIARTVQHRQGRIPLHTLRENINYGFSEAKTVYGMIGVKCWICTKDKSL